MRVLLAQRFFRPVGGGERHLFDVRALLRDPASREVVPALGPMLYSFEARRRIGRLVDRTHPDVARLPRQ